MAEVTLDFAKVNSDLYTAGTLYKTAQITAYKAVFVTALVEDTQATEADAIDIGSLRQVANELNAMMFQVNTGTNPAAGTVVVFVTDGHHVDTDSLTLRLAAIAGSVTVTEETALGGLTV